MAGYCGVFVEIQASNSDRSEIHRCRVEFVEVIGSELREPISCGFVNEMGAA